MTCELLVHRISTFHRSIFHSRLAYFFCHPFLSSPFYPSLPQPSLTSSALNYLLYCFLTALGCTLFIPSTANDGPPAAFCLNSGLFFIASNNEVVELKIKSFCAGQNNIIEFMVRDSFSLFHLAEGEILKIETWIVRLPSLLFPKGHSAVSTLRTFFICT